MSSLRLVEPVLLLPPPQAISTVDSTASNADQNPSRLRGSLKALPPQEISSDLEGTLRASRWPSRSRYPPDASSVRASPTDLSVSAPAATGRCRMVFPL